MPYLIIAALLAIGYWGYTRSRAGVPLLPGGATRPTTPEQIVRTDVPPAISNEVLDLLRNGRDPQSMHDVATEMEKYGFFDAAMLLHKRADELAILQRRVDEILTGRGLNPATASPTLREAILQGLMLVPTAPSAGLQARPITVGQALQEPGTFLRVAATATGLVVFLLLGTGVAVAVALLKGPLWGVATAALLGGGFYLYRDFALDEYQRVLGFNV